MLVDSGIWGISHCRYEISIEKIWVGRDLVCLDSLVSRIVLTI